MTSTLGIDQLIYLILLHREASQSACTCSERTAVQEEVHELYIKTSLLPCWSLRGPPQS